MKINNVNSNLIYLIPCILAILQEYYISSLIYFTMFFVSSKYHSIDDYRESKNKKNKNRYLEYQKIDIFVAYLVVFNNFYIILKNYKKHSIICSLSALIAIISFIFYKKCACIRFTTQQIYNKCHPYWHISTGIGSAILFLY